MPCMCIYIYGQRPELRATPLRPSVVYSSWMQVSVHLILPSLASLRELQRLHTEPEPEEARSDHVQGHSPPYSEVSHLDRFTEAKLGIHNIRYYLAFKLSAHSLHKQPNLNFHLAPRGP
jgi:hypothetical protein